MSWLADIAGKAENFLNKIDQNAAVALNAGEDQDSRSSSRSRSRSSNRRISHNNGGDNFENVSQIHVPDPEETISSTAFFNNDFSKSETNALEKSSNNVNVNTTNGNGSPQSNQLNNVAALSVSAPSGTRSKPKKPDQIVNANSVSNNVLKQKKNVSAEATSISSKKTDEELLNFLNSPDQQEIDEIPLLRKEIASQRHEMEIIVKKHKLLLQDYEKQRKELDELQIRLKNSEGQISSEEASNRIELERLQAQLKENDEELQITRDRLEEALRKLKGMDKLLNLQDRVEQLELENKQAETKNVELAQKLEALTTQLQSSEKQIQSAKEALTDSENKFSSYKEKAKAILRSKDDLITSLRGNNVGNDGNASETQVMVEIGSLKSERELLFGEISQSRSLCDSLKDENRRLEAEIQNSRVNFAELQDTYSQNLSLSRSVQEENLVASQKISALQLELEREKIEKRQLEENIKKLITQKEAGISSAKRNEYQENNSLASNNTSNGDVFSDRENLKTRIKALSQSLMEKQSLINKISEEKQLLQIRVERLQAQIQENSNEALCNSNFSQTVISSQPLYLSESPWDSQMTTRVKRVYSKVDTLCCEFGLAMRRRPNLRLGFSAYIILLHLWVFFVLFYWSHSTPLSHPDLDPNKHKK